MHLSEVTLFLRLRMSGLDLSVLLAASATPEKDTRDYGIWASEKCVCLRNLNAQPTAACYWSMPVLLLDSELNANSVSMVCLQGIQIWLIQDVQITKENILPTICTANFN